ncbi:GNAT family N-acetyltransferase [Aneurinibacillus tyrosinisolvens]|uniref:GNAT family N-acetyltransferase n=1 Tax=Aneurinibacillus tyrosinisolvens TaxID=1443435 RepID=UPI00063F2841|nr:GNAT family N-acetyltransferase [Aneurinibacillus tyrosinisolvens]
MKTIQSDYQQTFSGLVSILENNADEIIHIRVYDEYRFAFINDLGEIRLSCMISEDNEFVVRKIEFENQRTGTGTQVLYWLKDFAKNNGYKSIWLESAITDASRQFAEKHGFDNTTGADPDNYELKLM